MRQRRGRTAARGRGSTSSARDTACLGRRAGCTAPAPPRAPPQDPLLPSPLPRSHRLAATSVLHGLAVTVFAQNASSSVVTGNVVFCFYCWALMGLLSILVSIVLVSALDDYRIGLHFTSNRKSYFNLRWSVTSSACRGERIHKLVR